MKTPVLLLLVAGLFYVACKDSPKNAPHSPRTEVPLMTSAGSGCKYGNNVHAATAFYHNPKTGHKARYALKVHVEDCKVIQIDFPKGGWLDEDHIPRTRIDSNGTASLTDDRGRQWVIRLIE